jgi:hypothetical protein
MNAVRLQEKVMESRAERIRTLLKQRAAIDEELEQIQAQVAAERDALKSLRPARKPRNPLQAKLALVGEAQ